jgi:glycosyltransferase involved in cell wall biosynthesis
VASGATSSSLQGFRLTEEPQLRIALAIGTLRSGGAETQLVGLARALHDKGHYVEVFLVNDRGLLQAELDELGIKVSCAGMKGFHRPGGRPTGLGVLLAIGHPFAEFWRLLTLLVTVARGRFDVMQAYLFHAYAILIPWAWVARIPVRIAARRGLHANLPDTLVVAAFTRLSVTTATAVVANAAAVAEDAHHHENVPRAKLHVIRNGLAPAAVVANPGVDPPTGLLVANLIHYKGHLDLVDALCLLDPAVRGRVRIRCIGEGPMREAVAAARDAASLQEQLLLEGSLPALVHYQDAQYALLVSHQEGLPNAIMEAMASGLPVVATDVGGCRELVEDGVTGLLVAPRDPHALAEALTRINEDSVFRIAAGACARDRAREFLWENNVRSHVELYRSLGRR